MKFRVFQIDAKSLFSNEDQNLFDREEGPAKRAYLNATLSGDVKPALLMGLFEHVSDIESETLDQVFEIGNIGPEVNIHRFKRMKSISVGDIVLTPDNGLYSCDHLGWKQVVNPEDPEIEQIEKAAAKLLSTLNTTPKPENTGAAKSGPSF